MFTTADFDELIDNLKDRRGRIHVLRRIERLADNNPGDVRRIGGGVFELRVNTGPGYRVYYTQHLSTLVILLCGGDKSTQRRDIRKAYRLAEDWRADIEEADSDDK